MFKINNDWDFFLTSEFKKTYFINLLKFLDKEYSQYNIHPPRDDIFNAFRYCDFQEVKVVIIGQDPYHNPGEAHGLAFSVLDNVKLPPSLKNIYKEIELEFNIKMPSNGNLMPWAKQGVLLLNTILTVRENTPSSHKGQGWEEFTNNVIRLLNKKADSLVFLLWGAHAQKLSKLITNKHHYILTSPHPSPLSSYRGFLGNNHFKKTNEILLKENKKPIKWQL